MPFLHQLLRQYTNPVRPLAIQRKRLSGLKKPDIHKLTPTITAAVIILPDPQHNLKLCAAKIINTVIPKSLINHKPVSHTFQCLLIYHSFFAANIKTRFLKQRKIITCPQTVAICKLVARYLFSCSSSKYREELIQIMPCANLKKCLPRNFPTHLKY